MCGLPWGGWVSLEWVGFPGVGGLPWSGRASLEWEGFLTTPESLPLSSVVVSQCSRQPGLWVPIALDVEKGTHTIPYNLEHV